MKWSNFHVTVNFNVVGDALMRPMRAAIERMVEGDNLWLWLRHYNGHSQEEFSAQESMLVDRVRVRAAFEDGGKNNKALHAHLVIEVAHETMVQINKFELVQYFEAAVGAKPNIHCRFVRGEGEDKDFILRYITKEVPSYKPANWQNSKLQNAFNSRQAQADAEEHPMGKY